MAVSINVSPHKKFKFLTFQKCWNKVQTAVINFNIYHSYTTYVFLFDRSPCRLSSITTMKVNFRLKRSTKTPICSWTERLSTQKNRICDDATLCHKALRWTDFFFALNGFTKIISRQKTKSCSSVQFIILQTEISDTFLIYVYSYKKFKQTWSIVSILYFKLRLLYQVKWKLTWQAKC